MREKGRAEMSEWFCVIIAYTHNGKIHPAYPNPIGYIPMGGAPTYRGKEYVNELNGTDAQIAYYTKTASGWSYAYSSTPVTYECCDRPPTTLDIDASLIVDTNE